MTSWSSGFAPLLASFMASTVEFVEALTIVLAVGVVRGWRSALLGAGAGLALLVVLVLALGPSLTLLPLGIVQVVVGTLLLMFGLRWLRKAILRAAGVLSLHDEGAAFDKQADAMRDRDRRWWRGIDTVAAVASFKIVVLEGIEVVFIVVAIGASGAMLAPAAAGAALALLLVVALGLWLHRPLARVPENTLKFVVGAMLSAFGTFWVGEGMALSWPGGDRAIAALIATFLVAAGILSQASRWLHRRASHRARPSRMTPAPAPARGALASFMAELAGLVVDDGWLAAGIVLVLGGTALAVAQAAPASTEAWPLALVSALLAVLGASALRRAAA